MYSECKKLPDGTFFCIKTKLPKQHTYLELYKNIYGIQYSVHHLEVLL